MGWQRGHRGVGGLGRFEQNSSRVSPGVAAAKMEEWVSSMRGLRLWSEVQDQLPRLGFLHGWRLGGAEGRGALGPDSVSWAQREPKCTTTTNAFKQTLARSSSSAAGWVTLTKTLESDAQGPKAGALRPHFLLLPLPFISVLTIDSPLAHLVLSPGHLVCAPDPAPSSSGPLSTHHLLHIVWGN